MQIDTYQLGNNSISINPRRGCNLFSWKVDNRELLYFPEDSEYFYSGGNPILFPSVGRTWDRSKCEPVAEVYRIAGYKGIYKMPCHGILPLGDWEKINEKINKDEVQIDYSFFVSQVVLDKHYPFDVSFRMRYIFSLNRIVMKAFFRNEGAVPAPIAFGLHPYFNFTDKKNITIDLPCRNRVILDPDLLIPIGRQLFDSSTISLETGKSYDMAFDTTGSIEGNRASITDGTERFRLDIDFDENIKMLVIYSNSKSDFVCLEPWTKGLGGYEYLNIDGWQHGDKLIILNPGELKTITISYSVQNL